MEKEIFDPFFADFLKFSLKTQEPRENLKKELKKYYKDIKSICEKRPEEWTVETIRGKETDNTSLFSSSFVPENIGKEIEKCEKFFIFKTTIDNNFLVTVKCCVNNNEIVDDYCLYFVKIYAWLKFIYKYSDKKQKKFTLYLYLSDYKKELPSTTTGILDQVNCNTAVTYACAMNGECLIYRKEEWFKVLLHETMHSLCLDFSGLDYKNIKDKIKGIFPVKSKFEISESYSEFWAVFLNTTFKSASVSNTEEAFLENWEIMMFTENVFTMFQVTKILDFLVKQNYKGVIIEGTGLGHVSSNWYNSIKSAVNSGVIIGITSQCIAGRVSLNVYDTGRDLLSLGVIPLEDIVPETALAKLMWVLGNYKNIDEAKKIMLTNLTGEFSNRSLSTLGKY